MTVRVESAGDGFRVYVNEHYCGTFERRSEAIREARRHLRILGRDDLARELGRTAIVEKMPKGEGS